MFPVEVLTEAGNMDIATVLSGLDPEHLNALKALSAAMGKAQAWHARAYSYR